MKTLTKITSLVLASVLMLSGCKSTDTPVEQSDETTFSGFLQDYGKLEAVESQDGAQLEAWISESVDKTKYKKLMLTTLEFYPEAPTLAQASPEVLQQIKGYFNEAMQSQLGNDYALVTEPGEDVLNVKMAITSIMIDDKPLSLYQYIPVGFLVSAVSGNLSNMSVKMQVETEVTDSMTGEVVALAVKRGEGEKLKNDSTPLSLESLSPLIDSWVETFKTNLGKNLKN